MKVVVTGATGRLGTHVVERLLLARHEVVAVSRLGTLPALPADSSGAPLSLRSLAADIETDECVEHLAAELAPDAALVHLAALRVPPVEEAEPSVRRRLIAVNVHGTQRVLEAARRGVSAIVFASCTEVFGERKAEAELSEATPVAPPGNYAITKLAGEDHVLAFGREVGVRTVVLRLEEFTGGTRVAAAASAVEHALTRTAGGIFVLSSGQRHAFGAT